MRYLLLACLSGIVFSGCAAIEDYSYCFTNHRRAASAWKATYSRVDRRNFSADYESGWKAGYFDISMGGCGEPPVVPPNKYWSTKFQCEEGQAAIEQWYTGFQDGVIAAESRGSGAFHYIPTGPNVPVPVEGLAAGVVEGVMAMPIDASTKFLGEAQYFLQPFETNVYEHVPESRAEQVAPPPAAAQPMPQQNTSSTTPAQPIRYPDPSTPAELTNVPPVVTEE